MGFFCSLVENMSVNHGCAYVAVAKEFLDGADVVAIFEQVGCKGEAECVAAGVFVVRCIRDSSKSLRPIGGAQVAAGNGVGRAPRNPGKRG